MNLYRNHKPYVVVHTVVHAHIQREPVLVYTGSLMVGRKEHCFNIFGNVHNYGVMEIRD